MKKIEKNSELIVGLNYIVRAKTSHTNPDYKPVAEVTTVKELSGMKAIFNRLWAMDDNNQALERYDIYGPIDLDSMIDELPNIESDTITKKLVERDEQFEMTRIRFSKIYEQFDKLSDVGEFYDIVVLQENDCWTQAHVVGKSLDNYLLFGGWFIGGCLKAKDYMTLEEFNHIQPHNQGHGTTMLKLPVTSYTSKYKIAGDIK